MVLEAAPLPVSEQAVNPAPPKKAKHGDSHTYTTHTSCLTCANK